MKTTTEEETNPDWITQDGVWLKKGKMTYDEYLLLRSEV